MEEREMNKFKKLFLSRLLVAMVYMLSTTAFATDNDSVPTYDADTREMYSELYAQDQEVIKDIEKNI